MNDPSAATGSVAAPEGMAPTHEEAGQEQHQEFGEGTTPSPSAATAKGKGTTAEEAKDKEAGTPARPARKVGDGSFYTDSVEDVPDSRPCPAFVAPGDLHIQAMFLHHDGKMGVRQGGTDFRTANYSPKQMETQQQQMLKRPETVFTDIPTTHLLFSISRLENATPEQKAAILHPFDVDSVRNGSEDLFMAPVRLEESLELLNNVAPANGRPEKPSGVDMQNPVHVTAWAMHLMSELADAELYARLKVWEAKHSSSPPTEEAIPELHADALRVALDLSTGTKLFQKTRKLLQELTDIRLSSVSGTRRMKDAIYVCSGNYKSIGLDKPLGSKVDRAQIRHHIRSHLYYVRFLSPIVAADAALYTRKEVVLCRAIGFRKQIALDEAEKVGLGDRMVVVAQEISTFQVEQGPVLPWNRGAPNANDIVHKHYEKCINGVFPRWVTKTAAIKMTTNKGILGQFKSQALTVLAAVIMKVEPRQRKGYVKSRIPKGLRTDVLNLLNSKFGKLGGYFSDTVSYNPDRGTQEFACAYVAAYMVMLWTHSVPGCDNMLDDLEYFLRSDYEGKTSGDHLVQMQSLATHLVEKYAIPVLGLVMNMKKFCNYKERYLCKCQWLWYLQQAVLCQELASLYSRQIQAVPGVPVLSKQLDIPNLCYRLSEKIHEGKIFAVADLLSIPLPENEKHGIPAENGTRCYPNTTLEDFSLLFKVRDDNDICVNLSGLQDLAYGCSLVVDPTSNTPDAAKHLLEIIVGRGDPFDWPEFLEFKPPEQEKEKGASAEKNKKSVGAPGDGAGNDGAPSSGAPGDGSGGGSGGGSSGPSQGNPTTKKRKPEEEEGEQGEKRSKKTNEDEENPAPEKPIRKIKKASDFSGLTEEEREECGRQRERLESPELSENYFASQQWVYRKGKKEAVVDALRQLEEGALDEDEGYVPPPDEEVAEYKPDETEVAAGEAESDGGGSGESDDDSNGDRSNRGGDDDDSSSDNGSDGDHE